MKPETPRNLTIVAKPRTTSTSPQNSDFLPLSASDFTMEAKKHMPHDGNR
jgi:hypothetical protein